MIYRFAHSSLLLPEAGGTSGFEPLPAKTVWSSLDALKVPVPKLTGSLVCTCGTIQISNTGCYILCHGSHETADYLLLYCPLHGDLKPVSSRKSVLLSFPSELF